MIEDFGIVEGNSEIFINEAVLKLRRVGLEIVRFPGGNDEHNRRAAFAVAEYLEEMARLEIAEITYVYRTKDYGIKKIDQKFSDTDRRMWLEVADVLRNPEGHSLLEIACAYYAVSERGQRVEYTSDHAREPIELTFGFAASRLLGVGGFGIPKHHHSFTKAYSGQIVFLP